MSTKVTTGVCRANFGALFEPKGFDGAEPRYSVQLIIPKTDTKTVDAIRAAINAAVDKKWGDKAPKQIRSTLRDGDAEGKGPAYDGCYFLNAKGKSRPGIVDAALQEIINADDLIDGDYIKVSMNAYGYDVSGNKGVAFGLNNIQKVRDGEPLSGQTRPTDDFTVLSDDEIAA